MLERTPGASLGTGARFRRALRASLAVGLGLGLAVLVALFAWFAHAVSSLNAGHERPLLVEVSERPSAAETRNGTTSGSDATVEATMLADGRLYVCRSTRSTGGIRLVEEFWIGPGAHGSPGVEVAARTEDSSEPRLRWPYHGLGGTVRLSSASPPRVGGPPLVIAWDLEGDCSGSPVARSGRLAVYAEDVR